GAPGEEGPADGSVAGGRGATTGIETMSTLGAAECSARLHYVTIHPTPAAFVPPADRRPVLLAFGALIALQCLCIFRQQTPFLEDDAAFFLRYAENLANGNGWRWNVEEPPVWGASAPLWPLLIAAGIRLGLAAEQSCLLFSWMLALGASAVLATVALRLRGILGVVALAPLLSVNHLYSTWATSGMESPMTFLCIALVLLAASGVGGSGFLGLAAGACLVHKLDLAPLGVALLAGAFVWRRAALARALPVAFGMALAWYGFATWYFGSPVP